MQNLRTKGYGDFDLPLFFLSYRIKRPMVYGSVPSMVTTHRTKMPPVVKREPTLTTQV